MYSYNADATHVTQISIRKMKTTKSLARAHSHNNRIGETQYHIDMRREELNETLLDNSKTGSYILDILNDVTGEDYDYSDLSHIDKDNLRYADGTKIRNTSVLAAECKSGYPGDLKWVELDKDGHVVDIPKGERPDPEKGHFQYPANIEEFHEWQNLTVSFLKERFGENNVLQVQCHMDEAVPHIHAIISPAYTNGYGQRRLSFSHYVNGPKELAQLQTQYASYLSGLGYQRGKEWSANKGRVNGMTATKARALMQASFDEVPHPIEKSLVQEAIDSRDPAKKDEMLQRLMENEQELNTYAQKVSVENTMSEVRAAQIDTDGEKLAKARRLASELKQKLRETEIKQNEERKNYEKEIRRLQLSSQKEECRRKGMEIYEDKDLVDNIEKINAIWEEDGRKWFEDHGVSIDLEDRENAKE